MSQNSLGGAGDLRPDENEIVAARKDAARHKYRLLTVMIAVILLIALVALFATQNCVCANPAVSQPAATPPKPEAQWSEWTDVLPSYINREDYLVEEQTLYRSRELETTSSETQSAMDGWELYDTITADDYSEWSDWSFDEITESDTRQVKKETVYRYREKETKSSSKDSLEGWELYDTTYKKGDYGDWSKWSTKKVTENDNRKVESKKQYRYRTKNYTSSSQSSLSGWTQYDKSYVWSDYGSWSGWSDTEVSETSSRDVETRKVLVSEGKTTYTYGAYFSSNSSKPYSWTHFCDKCAKSAYGGTWKYKTVTQSSRATVSTLGQSCGHQGKIKNQYRASNGYLYYFESKKTTDDVYKTQYRYRTREKIYTYYYYQWSDWSKWSESSVSKTDERNVESRVLYRHKEREDIPTYHYYRWGDWSKWQKEKPKEANNRKIESKIRYSYRDKVEHTTYLFRRWGPWTAYTYTPAEPTDTRQVETMPMYRYKKK